MSKLEAYKAERTRVNKIAGKNSAKPRYVIVWGNLFREYTGTTACTGLQSVSVSTKREAIAKVNQLCDEVSFLIHVIDLKTGKQADI